MASLAITIFIMAIAGTLFMLPFKVGQFSRNEYVNLVARRSCFVLGFYFMTLNAAIMATIADFASIPVTTEMFMYMTIFGWAGYVAMLTLAFKTAVDIIQIKKARKLEARIT